LYVRKSLIASFALSVREPVDPPLSDDLVELVSGTSEESRLDLRPVRVKQLDLQKRLAFDCRPQRGLEGHASLDAPVLHERVKGFNGCVDLSLFHCFWLLRDLEFVEHVDFVS